MSTQIIPSDIHTRLENFKPKDLKNLVQQQGKTTEGDKEFTLQEPPLSDPSLQALINDPDLEIRAIGDQNKSGEMYYDIKANGRQVRIKVSCRKLK